MGDAAGGSKAASFKMWVKEIGKEIGLPGDRGFFVSALTGGLEARLEKLPNHYLVKSACAGCTASPR